MKLPGSVVDLNATVHYTNGPRDIMKLMGTVVLTDNAINSMSQLTHAYLILGMSSIFNATFNQSAWTKFCYTQMVLV